jgi:hypothetical protein
MSISQSRSPSSSPSEAQPPSRPRSRSNSWSPEMRNPPDLDNTEVALNVDNADLDSELTRPRRIPTWRERHALKLLGVIMVACFAMVIIAQTAC